MSDMKSRRDFLKTGTTAAAGLLAAGALKPATAQELGAPPSEDLILPSASSGGAVQNDAAETDAPIQPTLHEIRDDYEGFFRYKPSRGNNPESPFYLGKTVPGRRTTAGPAPFIAPDLDKLPWKRNGEWKEFHLVAQAVSREFLPGYAMNLYGFNGSMPGPTIEVFQGDKVRVVVHNELKEDLAVHWHGFELMIQFDGSETITQNLMPPGGSFVYEFDLHEAGTFFYHSHNPMQETDGMVGWFIIHPRPDYDPPVDRDFGLIFQNFRINPMQTVNDSWSMDWNWHTINGRSGPFTTPLVCRHGERVRIRVMDFSPVQHHPIHLHGHTFWITGHEGARIPKSAWIPRNTELVGVAQAADLEFIANNPGDWFLHCHMTHHMMNHMVRHVGPRIRPGVDVDAYLANLESRPSVTVPTDGMPPFDKGNNVPGYPQTMAISMHQPTVAAMMRIKSRRETLGMRGSWPMSVKGLMTLVRVLPDDLYHRVMETEEAVADGEIFEEIVRRFGKPGMYEPVKPMPRVPGETMQDMQFHMQNRSQP